MKEMFTWRHFALEIHIEKLDKWYLEMWIVLASKTGFKVAGPSKSVAVATTINFQRSFHLPAAALPVRGSACGYLTAQIKGRDTPTHNPLPLLSTLQVESVLTI